jgi:hypothetical protein
MDQLVDRRLLVTTDLATTGEQAVRLASAALALWDLEPKARMAIATGRASFIGNLPVGPLMDRLPTLLPAGEGGTICLDDATRKLLPARFVIGEFMDHQYLLSTVSATVHDADSPESDTTPTPLPTRSRRSSVSDG